MTIIIDAIDIERIIREYYEQLQDNKFDTIKWTHSLKDTNYQSSNKEKQHEQPYISFLNETYS